MDNELHHMRRAFDLARAGIGLASPNPAVGTVVVDSSGKKAGEGTHTYDGVKHAEVLALEQALAAEPSTSTSNPARIKDEPRPAPTPSSPPESAESYARCKIPIRR